MVGIVELGAIKLLIDILEGGPGAAVKGIVTSVIPGGNLLTVADSVDYLFDLSGRYSGIIDSSNYPTYSAYNFEFVNKTELEFALSKYDFPALANKKFTEMNQRNFPNF